MDDKKGKTGRVRNLAMTGDISWHLIQSLITKDRKLVIEIEQRVNNGAVASVTLSPKDYVIAKSIGGERLQFICGIYACDNCEIMLEHIEMCEEYDSFSLRTFERDLATGERRYTGLTHWSESHNHLNIRHNNKITRFGKSTNDMIAEAEMA